MKLCMSLVVIRIIAPISDTLLALLSQILSFFYYKWNCMYALSISGNALSRVARSLAYLDFNLI